MAAFLVQPHVTEFLDVVMHDREMELRLEELEIAADSPLANITVGQAHVRDQTGALILAIRDPDGEFITSPGADTTMEPGHVLIAIGTSSQLAALEAAASRPGGDGVTAAEIVGQMTDDEKLWCLDGDAPCWAGLTYLGTGGYHRSPFYAARVERLGLPGLRVLRRAAGRRRRPSDVLPGEHGPRRDLGPRSRGADRRRDRTGAAGDRRHPLRRRVRQRAAPPGMGPGAGDLRRGPPPRRRDGRGAHSRRAAPRDGDA